MTMSITMGRVMFVVAVCTLCKRRTNLVELFFRKLWFAWLMRRTPPIGSSCVRIIIIVVVVGPGIGTNVVRIWIKSVAGAVRCVWIPSDSMIRKRVGFWQMQTTTRHVGPIPNDACP